MQGCINKFKNISGKSYEWMEFYRQTFPHTSTPKPKIELPEISEKEQSIIRFIKQGTYVDTKKIEERYYREKASKAREDRIKETCKTAKIVIAKPDNLKQLAKDGHNILITGNAGTGKTYRLKEIFKYLKERGKNVVVLAPTGIAAENTEIGATIHSFLKLKLGPWLPNARNNDSDRLSSYDLPLIRAVETIIIDEISMVRCDLMDQMDHVLRKARGIKKPFGGIQVIMFGDLFQLMPVVTDEDNDILNKAYTI